MKSSWMKFLICFLATAHVTPTQESVLQNLCCTLRKYYVPQTFLCTVSCVIDWQIDEDMTAKLDLCHARFSFMENELVYVPNWMAPEGNCIANL